MRHVASVRPTRPASPDYSKVFADERAILRTLPSWQYALFALMVDFSNFRSGVGVASVDDLILGLTPIQPSTGPKHFVPSEMAVYRAIVGFEERNLLKRDKRRSQSEKVIHYLLDPRNAKPRPTPELVGLTRRAVDNRKARNGAAYSGSHA